MFESLTFRPPDSREPCFGAGAVPGFSKGYVLYGKEGTLFLDLEAKKLFLTKRDGGGQRTEVAISEDKKEVWKVRAIALRLEQRTCASLMGPQGMLAD